jgi:hypothetical protein
MTSKWFCLILGMTSAAATAGATPIAFATVGYAGGSGSNVTYSMSGGTLHTGTGASAAPILVSFGFQHLPGMPAALPTNVQAFMTWSTTRTSGVAGDVNCGAMCTQAMNSGTLTITAVNPLMSNHGLANILLRATFTGSVFGGLHGDGFSMGADNQQGNTVVYSSDFFDFRSSTVSSFNFSFYSVLADLARSGGNFTSLLASGAGVFMANNIRSNFAPEPSTFVLGAMALLALAMLRKRSRSTTA